MRSLLAAAADGVVAPEAGEVVVVIPRRQEGVGVGAGADVAAVLEPLEQLATRPVAAGLVGVVVAAAEAEVGVEVEAARFRDLVLAKKVWQDQLASTATPNCSLTLPCAY
jgi:hypothetical protein